MFNLAEIELTVGKISFVILSVVLLCTGFYWYGKHVQSNVDNALAAKQAVQSAKIKGDQDATTFAVAETYSEYIHTLQSKLDRLRQSASATPVSSATLDSKGADAAEPEFGRTCTRTFYENALTDVLTLTAWQDWAKNQHIPVK